MKLKPTLGILFGLCVTLSINAQTYLKIGHVNMQEIIQKHPALDSIKNVLESESKEIENLYNEMIKEHDSRLEIFEKEKSGYSEFIRKSKESELIQMAQKIQDYNQNAQLQLQKRNKELIEPVYAQINSLIKEVSDQNNFTYILEVSNGAVAYAAPGSENITPMILEKLVKTK